ncbi:DHB14 dehydrogenase, partial [Amia calva]|nr:DHB14 dehydrogenase [Amia calva]
MYGCQGNNDPALSYTQHITLTCTCRCFLSNIHRIRPFLTNFSTQLLVQSLVLSRLDYCNSLLAGLLATTTRPLQLIQNSASRLVFSKMVGVTIEQFGRIDCLVNNAGWHPPHKSTDETSAQEFTELLQLNVISYFLTAKYALPHLRRTQGSVVNVSSLVASIGQKHAVPYVTTKGAIVAMTKAMAVDESQYRVRVNCLSPGNVMTPLWEELADYTPDPAFCVREGENAQLIGRMGTAVECGLAVLFLAADASFCTGIELLLSGGAELNYGHKSQISQSGPSSSLPAQSQQ